MKQQPVIKVLKVEPDKAPELIEMKNELEAMQSIVGGYIEVFPLADGVTIVCNEEGKICGMEPNRPIYHDGKIFEIICGTFFIAGDDLSTGEFVSLTDEQIAQYEKQFHDPVYFVKIEGVLYAVPRGDVKRERG